MVELKKRIALRVTAVLVAVAMIMPFALTGGWQSAYADDGANRTGVELQQDPGHQSDAEGVETENVVSDTESAADHEIEAAQISEGTAQTQVTESAPNKESNIETKDRTTPQADRVNKSKNKKKSKHGSDRIRIKFNVTKEDGLFNETLNNTTVSYQDLDVPYFDLALYGLENFYYNPDCYTGTQGPGTPETANGVVTGMHAFIYATEIFQLGYSPEQAGRGLGASKLSNHISWGGSAGSSFMTFWGGTYNINYYVNWTYPLGRPGLGSTSDQIALNNGDIINVHVIGEGWGANFSHFKDPSDNKYEATLKKGEHIKLSLLHSEPDYTDYSTKYLPSKGFGVKRTKANSYSELIPDLSDPAWVSVGTTNQDDGTITLDTSSWEPGTYFIASEGGAQILQSECEVAVFKIVVKADTVKITFNPNGGNWNGNSGKRVVEVKKGNKITLAKAPVRKGYEFISWGDLEYKPGCEYQADKDHLFTAVWQKIKSKQPKPNGGHDEYNKVQNGKTKINVSINKTNAVYDNIRTGDNAPILLLLVTIALAVFGITIIVRHRLKNKRN